MVVFAYALMSSVAMSLTFDKFGTKVTTQFRPPTSLVDFKYDLVYYLPKSLKAKKNYKTLVFLHGGGSSTRTRAGSLNVINAYFRDLKQMADELGFALIMPSGSGLNWGGQMISMLKDINLVLKQELAIDPNGIALSGHSMGGMGITRSAHWLADEYAFFMPLAAGMHDDYIKERVLKTYLNFPYHIMVGRNDHFTSFTTQSQKQERFIRRLEQKYNALPMFKFEPYNGGHNYDRQLVKNRLKQAFAKYDRANHLYQKRLWGNLNYRRKVVNTWWTYGVDVYMGPLDRYFWVKGQDFYLESKTVPFTAMIKGNNVAIKIGKQGQEKIVKTLRLFFKDKIMVDLSKPVQIRVNGELLFDQKLPRNLDMSEILAQDRGYQFDTYIDIEL
jgi:acetyl esterase/lipase